MKIPLTITDEGLTALMDAEAGTTSAVRIAELGLSAQPFIAAPSLTDLPGEFKRIAVTAGQAAAENIIHFVAEDGGAEAYDVTGIGLYTDGGVLFGVFSHLLEEGPLFGKSVSTAFLFAADITFQAGVAELIDFGDSNFTYPPATETTKGVAYLATADDVEGGEDDEKIVTPALLAGAYVPLAQKAVPDGVATLDASGRVPPAQLPPQDSIDTFYASSDAEMLALAAATPGDFCQREDLDKTYRLAAAPPNVLANWIEFLSPGAPVRTVNGKIGNVELVAADVGAPPVARTIDAGGLAKGGGSLGANRTITVDIASAAETLAGLINDKAVTPASLAQVLAALGAKVPATRKVDTAGLATGGGSLAADRTITVPKASAADVEAGASDDKAITPAALWGTLRSIGSTGYLLVPGTPIIIQWGQSSVPTSGVRTVTFPVAYPTAVFQTMMTPYGDPDDGDESDEIPYVTAMSATSFNCRISGDNKSFGFGWLAIGA